MYKIIFVFIVIIFPFSTQAFSSSKGEVDSFDIIDYEVEGNVTKFIYKTDILIDKDILSPTTEQVGEKTYKIYPSQQFYNDGGIWYQVEFATTTSTKFQANPLSKGWFFNTAYAALIYPVGSCGLNSDGTVTWTLSRDDTSANQVDTTDTQYLDVSFNTLYYLNRIVLQFDTSSIGAGNQVDTATLTLTADDEASNTLDMNLTAFTGDNTACNAGDVDNFLDTRFSTDTTTGSWANGTTKVLALNSTGLDYFTVTGYTNFMLRGAEDIDNSAPGGAKYKEIRTAGYTGTASDPVLEITFSEAEEEGSTSTNSTSTESTTYDVGGIMFYSYILFFIGFIITLFGLNYIFI